MTRRLPIGAELLPGEGLSVRVWAPTHERVTLVLEAPERREVVLQREGDYHAALVPGVRAGQRYRFRLGDDPGLLPDPASRFQPEGPFGPSEVIDPWFQWTDATWQGLPPERHVLYELHVGTFTPEGTWAAAAEQLPFLADVGITTLELMPVAEFPGGHNWGYDGVDLFAPSHTYGRPEELRRFVDRAHELGLAVILDVVYNHFGPSGNYMFRWCPYYQSAEATEWGEALHYDGPHSAGVREFVVANAGYWIDEFHLDGLRVDATQTIHDRSPRHVLGEVVDRARAAAGDRRIVIVGENEPQRAELLELGFDALWNDDFHHSARVALTGTIDGYLHDYRGTPQELVSAVKRGFLYQGQLYPWQKQPRGTSTRGQPRTRFVHYLENHDQCANLGFGERLPALVHAGALRAMTALLLLSPELPMLFQGQETGSRRPWRFFVDHRADLHDAVRTGRAEFVAQFDQLATPDAQAALPNPCVPETYEACVLDPAERTLANPIVRLHRDLLRLRREDPVFTAAGAAPGALDGAVLGPHTLALRYFGEPAAGDRLLLVNLGPTFHEAAVPEPLVAPPAGTGWRLAWSSEAVEYGGRGTPEVSGRSGLAIPAYAAVLLVPDAAAALRREGPA